MNKHSGSEQVALPAESLQRAFPFLLVWDEELRILEIGPSMAKICRGIQPRDGLLDHFRMVRPHGESTWESFVQRLDMLHLLESIDTAQSFRGQLVLVGDRMLFLCTPWFDSPAALGESGLVMGDFATHDQTADLLQVVQAQQMANRDLHLLTTKLSEKSERLREKDQESRKLALVAARTDNGVIITDAEGRIEWVNEGFHRLSGWALEEAQGKRPGELLQGPLSDKETVQHMREAVRAGQGFTAKVVNYHRNGSSYWVEIEVQPILDQAGNLQNFIGLQRDVTEAEREERRRSVQFAVSLVLSEEGPLEEVMTQVLELIRKECQWEAGFFMRIDPKEERAQLVSSSHERGDRFSALEEHLRGQELALGREWLCRVVGLDGDDVAGFSGRGIDFGKGILAQAGFLRAAWVPLRGGKGEDAVLVFADGGERHENDSGVNKWLESIGAQLGQFLARKRTEEALRRTTAEAEAASRMKSEFLATMSHEIRTPMNGVLGFAEILRESELSPQQEGYVSSICSSATALLDVINDVLDVSRIESGNLEFELREIDLVHCVEEAVEIVSTSAEDKGLDLVVSFGEGVPAYIISDEVRLRQVLVNLLGNAVKFTDQGGIHVDLQGCGTADRFVLEVSVRDSGIGIDPAILPSLFASFRQADNSITRRFGGSGLGLAISKSIVEGLGGELSVESRLDEGSVFSFTLRNCWSGIEKAIGRLAVPEFEGARALLIQDEGLASESLATLLRGWKLEVTVARNPEDGRAVLSEVCPDIVFLDGSFAFDDISNFVQHRAATAAPVFMLVRRKDEDLVRGVFAERLSGVLTKPFRIGALSSSVASIREDHPLPDTVEERETEAPVEQKRLPAKVLLVEDNRVNQKFVLAALEHMGIEVDVAEDGLEALEAVEETGYDAILMDVHMPGMDGLTATRKLREREFELGLPATRIIGVTADALLGYEEICLSAGMDTYLSKPVRLAKLREALVGAVASDRNSLDFDSGQGEWGDPREGPLKALRQMSMELSWEDVHEVADDFCAEMPRLCETMEFAMRKRDLEEVRRLAHSLKGTASLFHVGELASLAGQIEESARLGHAVEVIERVAEIRDVAQRGASAVNSAWSALEEIEAGQGRE